MWVDEEGITHIRCASLTGTMAGDINGQIVGKENLNVDATFAGDLQVKAVIARARLLGNQSTRTIRHLCDPGNRKPQRNKNHRNNQWHTI